MFFIKKNQQLYQDFFYSSFFLFFLILFIPIIFLDTKDVVLFHNVNVIKKNDILFISKSEIV